MASELMFQVEQVVCIFTLHLSSCYSRSSALRKDFLHIHVQSKSTSMCKHAPKTVSWTVQRTMCAPTD